MLVAISGGIDSMVLLDLLIKSQTPLEVAHVDHSTREGQSTKDARFVELYCEELSIKFHKSIYTHEKGNFQAEARKFRSAFFDITLKNNNLDYIATGHHMDDVLEGFLLASFRGSHLNRLVTPKYIEKSYIRPLIFFDKKAILNYAEKHRIPFVEDLSNYENDYNRNFFRNTILPQVYSHMPQGKKGLINTLDKITKDNNLIIQLIELHKSHFLSRSEDNIIINLDYLINQNIIEILPHILTEYSFSNDQINKIPGSKTGALFFTPAFQGLRDRSKFIICPKKSVSVNPFFIYNPGSFSFGKHIILLQKSQQSAAVPIEDEQSLLINLLPKDFPLEIRTLQPGDKIKALNLKGKSTKISKALTDLKVDRLSKSKTIIIKTPHEIVWAYPYLKPYKKDILDSENWYKMTIVKKD